IRPREGPRGDHRCCEGQSRRDEEGGGPPQDVPHGAAPAGGAGEAQREGVSVSGDALFATKSARVGKCVAYPEIIDAQDVASTDLSAFANSPGGMSATIGALVLPPRDSSDLPRARVSCRSCRLRAATRPSAATVRPHCSRGTTVRAGVAVW